MRRVIGIVIILALFALLFTSIVYLRPFGEPIHKEMDEYFIKNAQKEASANNVVTSIVFDYRGFDTLGEATVLFAAVSGTLMILRHYINKGGREE